MQARLLRMPRVLPLLPQVRMCLPDDGPATTPATTGRRPRAQAQLRGVPLLSWQHCQTGGAHVRESAESQAQSYHCCPVVAHVAGRGRGGASRDWCQCRPYAQPGRRRQPSRLTQPRQPSGALGSRPRLGGAAVGSCQRHVDECIVGTTRVWGRQMPRSWTSIKRRAVAAVLLALPLRFSHQQSTPSWRAL